MLAKKITILLIISTLASCNDAQKREDFDGFYKKFQEDSLFQVSRISFPLYTKTSYLEEYGSIPRYIQPEEWLMHRNVALDSAQYQQKMFNVRDTMVIDVRYDGYKQGMVRHFSLRDGKWTLTYYSAYNPIDRAYLE